TCSAQRVSAAAIGRHCGLVEHSGAACLCRAGSVRDHGRSRRGSFGLRAAGARATRLAGQGRGLVVRCHVVPVEDGRAVGALAAPALTMLAGLAYLRWSERVRGWIHLVSPVALLVLVGLTWRQTRIWRDSYTFWSYTVAAEPSSAIAHGSYADQLMTLGRTDEAIRHYRESIELDPLYAEGHNNFGVALARMGRTQEAATE